MIKKILIGLGALVLLALILVSVRYLYTSSEKDGSSDTAEAATADNTGAEREEQDDPDSTVPGSEAEESTDVSGNAVTVEEEDAEAMAGEETAEDEDTDAAEEAAASSENGVLYTINTNAGNNLGMVHIVGGNAVILMDGGNASTYQGDYEPEEQSALNLKVEEVTAAAVSGSKIEAWAFYREANLRDFTFPDNVTAIEKFAFARSGLSSVSIPEGVTRIGYGAFYHCDALADVVIPDSVTVIEENAFSHTAWLDNWMTGAGEETTETSESDDFLIVGDGILLAYRGNEENPVLPDMVKSIVPGALGE